MEFHGEQRAKCRRGHDCPGALMLWEMQGFDALINAAEQVQFPTPKPVFTPIPCGSPRPGQREKKYFLVFERDSRQPLKVSAANPLAPLPLSPADFTGFKYDVTTNVVGGARHKCVVGCGAPLVYGPGFIVGAQEEKSGLLSRDFGGIYQAGLSGSQMHTAALITPRPIHSRMAK